MLVPCLAEAIAKQTGQHVLTVECYALSLFLYDKEEPLESFVESLAQTPVGEVK